MIYVSSCLNSQVSEDERGVQIAWCLRFETDEQHPVNSHRRLPAHRPTVIYARLAASSLAVTKTIASTRCPYLLRDGQAKLSWVGGYMRRWFARPETVTHPSTNRARRRVTSLIDSNALPLRQTGTKQKYYYISREAWPRQNVYWSWPSVCVCVCVSVCPWPRSHTTARTRM